MRTGNRGLRVLSVFASMVALGAVAACGDEGGGGGGGSWTDPVAHEVDCGDAGGGIVEGTVVAPNGSTPVIGATVSVEGVAGCQVATGPAGEFRMTGVPAGSASVRVRRGIFDQQASVAVSAGAVANADAELDASGISTGVVTGSFDQVETLLDELGIPWTAITSEDVVGGDLSGYDAVYLDCGLDDSVLYNDTSGNPVVPAELKEYAEAGGRVYASDWAEVFVEGAWPGKVGFLEPDPRVGEPGEFRGDLIDPALQASVQKDRLKIEFDLGGWALIDEPDSDVEVLVRGDAKGIDYDTFEVVTYEDRPWVVQFATGSNGSVTYTSFHNHAQLDADTHALLLQLVLGI